ncbi:MAG: hypothetical protein N4A31_02240 [Rickettsiales bacterium]|jgi:hypothetical protein|nr:hypothetical protein [Rickettsiales bacterium]
MRFNICQYNVQDRTYSKAEVLSLINNESYKHNLLSGNSYCYSVGTALEAVMAATKTVVQICTLSLDLSGKANEDYAITDKLVEPGEDYNYTGREVAAFLNKYYDYSYVLDFHAKANYDNMIIQFLQHEYIDAEVPTQDHHSIFDVAILNTTEVMGDSSGYEMVD